MRQRYSREDKKWVRQWILKHDVGVDAWPYASPFEECFKSFNNERIDRWGEPDFWKLVLAVRKAGLGREERAPALSSPPLSNALLARLRDLIPSRRGKIDRLPYTDEFENLYSEFCRFLTTPLSRNEVWRSVLKLVKSRVTKTARPFLDKAVCSLKLAINTFNSIDGISRSDTVLIYLHHSFEMLLKASLLQHRASVRDKETGWLISFETCVDHGLTVPKCKFLVFEQAQYLRTLNMLRGAAYHALSELDETELYLHANTGIRVFDEIIRDVFGQNLADLFGPRVLAISTVPLATIVVLLDRKQSQISSLLRAGEHLRALAATRSILALENTAGGENTAQPSLRETKAMLERVKAGENVVTCFPNVAALRLVDAGPGATLHLSLKGKGNYPVRVFPDDGTSEVVAIRTIDPTKEFNLSTHDLAEKCNVTFNAMVGAIKELDLKNDTTCCFMHGRTGAKTRTPGYSARALDRTRKLFAGHSGDPLFFYRKHCLKKVS